MTAVSRQKLLISVWRRRSLNRVFKPQFRRQEVLSEHQNFLVPNNSPGSPWTPGRISTRWAVSARNPQMPDSGNQRIAAGVAWKSFRRHARATFYSDQPTSWSQTNNNIKNKKMKKTLLVSAPSSFVARAIAEAQLSGLKILNVIPA